MMEQNQKPESFWKIDLFSFLGGGEVKAFRLNPQPISLVVPEAETDDRCDQFLPLLKPPRQTDAH